MKLPLRMPVLNVSGIAIQLPILMHDASAAAAAAAAAALMIMSEFASCCCLACFSFCLLSIVSYVVLLRHRHPACIPPHRTGRELHTPTANSSRRGMASVSVPRHTATHFVRPACSLQDLYKWPLRLQLRPDHVGTNAPKHDHIDPPRNRGSPQRET